MVFTKRSCILKQTCGGFLSMYDLLVHIRVLKGLSQNVFYTIVQCQNKYCYTDLFDFGTKRAQHDPKMRCPFFNLNFSY